MVGNLLAKINVPDTCPLTCDKLSAEIFALHLLIQNSRVAATGHTRELDIVGMRTGRTQPSRRDIEIIGFPRDQPNG